MNARPTLTLDFPLMAQRGYLDPILTFSRDSTATRINPQTGLIETVAANVPRLEKDGLLIEGAATNLVSWSTFPGELGAMPLGYSNNNNGNTCVLSNEVPPIIGDRVMRHQQNVQGDNLLAYIGLGVVPADDYVCSCWVWLPAQSQIELIQPSIDSGVVEWLVPIDLSTRDRWQRIALQCVSHAAGPANMTLRTAGNTTGVFFSCGWQTEAGAVATSYIPTSGAPVARAAENCYADLFGSWFNPNLFTLRVSALYARGSGIICILSNESGWAESVTASFTGGYMTIGVIRGGEGTDSMIKEAGDGVSAAAMVKSSDGVRFAINGSLSELMPSSLPGITRLTLGSNFGGSGSHINEHIRSLQILPWNTPGIVLRAMSQLQ